MLQNDEMQPKASVGSSEMMAPAAGLCAIVLLCASNFLPPSFAQKNVFLFILAVSLVSFLVPAAVFGIVNAKKANFLFAPPKKGTVKIVFSGAFLLVFTALLVRCVICSSGGTQQSSAGSLIAGMGYFEALFCYTLLPAVLEELLFRGIIFPLYEKRCGGLCAIVATSLLFAISHLSGVDFALYFLSGLILSVVAYITRSVFACIALHLINNITSFYLENSVFRIAAESKSGTLAIFLLALLVLVCLFWFLTVLEGVCRKRYLSASSDSFSAKKLFPDDTTKGQAVLRVVLSPFFWCAIVIYSIYISIA